MPPMLDCWALSFCAMTHPNFRFGLGFIMKKNTFPCLGSFQGWIRFPFPVSLRRTPAGKTQTSFMFSPFAQASTPALRSTRWLIGLASYTLTSLPIFSAMLSYAAWDSCGPWFSTGSLCASHPLKPASITTVGRVLTEECNHRFAFEFGTPRLHVLQEFQSWNRTGTCNCASGPVLTADINHHNVLLVPWRCHENPRFFSKSLHGNNTRNKDT